MVTSWICLMKECNVSDLIHLGIGGGHQTGQCDGEPSQPLHFCKLAVSPSGGGGGRVLYGWWQDKIPHRDQKSRLRWSQLVLRTSLFACSPQVCTYLLALVYKRYMFYLHNFVLWGKIWLTNEDIERADARRDYPGNTYGLTSFQLF